ncbi:hypothetical protein GCN74_09140 [Janthinobacterium sp. FT14W]|uniref:hypothetical protein n=1 Tax=Janthinobacterium sp. FT14W TaxID=2654253 RepID=UPI0012645156|nr:hypothetical protein [Janthinobacterium sp. FT14W]KAB8060431.1 hypothetical protein GCN74_09140 [Janthinobacterium sp. FT14W]
MQPFTTVPAPYHSVAPNLKSHCEPYLAAVGYAIQRVHGIVGQVDVVPTLVGIERHDVGCDGWWHIRHGEISGNSLKSAAIK